MDARPIRSPYNLPVMLARRGTAAPRPEPVPPPPLHRPISHRLPLTAAALGLACLAPVGVQYVSNRDTAVAPLPLKQLCAADSICVKYGHHDVRLPQYDALTDKQKALLSKTLGEQPAAAWAQLAQSHPDRVATFLANTHALSSVTFDVPSAGKSVPALDTLSGIQQLRGDRVFFEMDQQDASLAGVWSWEGGHYTMHLADGKVKHGRIHFDRGDLHGSLHEGADEQGYTSEFRPRIQWNVHNGTPTVADIDIDYRTPWKFGMLPNPFHMTYDNSVVIDHYATYVHKWGNPGFSVD